MWHVDLLSASKRDALASARLREYLLPLGLHESKPRVWIDGSNPPARRMFELELLKGAQMTASWGFSLDFVPHVSGGNLRWHRSDRLARLDVVIEPSDLPMVSFLHGEAYLNEGLGSLLGDAVERAQRAFARGSTLEGMLAMVREIRAAQSNTHRFNNYVQLPLALAFLSARVGEFSEATDELERWLARFQYEGQLAERFMTLLHEQRGQSGVT